MSTAIALPIRDICDWFPRLFPRVKVIENIGANLAPWNIGNYRIDFGGDQVLIDAARPLIFFHFQGLRKGMRWFIFNSHRSYRAPFSSVVRDHIYKPYVDELLAIEKTVDPHLQISATKPHRRSAVVDVRQYLKSKVRNPASACSGCWTSSPGAHFSCFAGRRIS